jgi:nucleoid-associated protein YgaU
VTTVEADEGGRFFATGQAAPGATVRLYLNDNFVAAATAGPDGRWSFTIGRGLGAGNYRVRLDDVDSTNGAVQSRAEVPFQFAPRVASAAGAAADAGAPPQPAAGIRPATSPQAPAALPAGSGAQVATATPSGSAQPAGPPGADILVPEVRSTLVTRGDSLWRISRRVYGRGVRYTVIYEANQQQIRDPARIYPGQIFVVPGEMAN